MDMHLKIIAQNHIESRFVCINAEKAPFFITKLQIQVLPTVILFTNGIAGDRIVGFDELGGEDEFDTIVLTRKLVKAKIIDAKNKSEEGRIKINKGKKDDDSEDSEDY